METSTEICESNKSKKKENLCLLEHKSHPTTCNLLIYHFVWALSKKVRCFWNTVTSWLAWFSNIPVKQVSSGSQEAVHSPGHDPSDNPSLP